MQGCPATTKHGVTRKRIAKGLKHTNFEFDLVCVIKSFFLHDQKVKSKSKYSENKKSF